MADFDFTNPPIQFAELDSDQGKKWNEQCCKVFYDEGYVRLGNINGVYARNYVRSYERIRDFEVFPDDIWVVSFPKCGTSNNKKFYYFIALFHRIYKNLNIFNLKELLGRRKWCGAL